MAILDKYNNELHQHDIVRVKDTLVGYSYGYIKELKGNNDNVLVALVGSVPILIPPKELERQVLTHGKSPDDLLYLLSAAYAREESLKGQYQTLKQTLLEKEEKIASVQKQVKRLLKSL